jgi:pimeloyl-ACP methyl ester carboxylesterase
MMADGARSRFIRYPLGRVHVLDLPGQGSQPPVVLLHGFSASGASQYRAMTRRIRPHVRRVLLPDFPGHGLSSIPYPFDARTLQAGLEAALRELVQEPVVIFATSMAGALAVRHAARHRSTVAGLMLSSPTGAPLEHDEFRRVTSQFRIGSHHQALRFVDRLFVGRPALRHAYAFGVRQQFNRPHLVKLLGSVRRDDFLRPDELRALDMPVQVVWGARDGVLPVSQCEYFREHLPRHAVIETPADAGHAPFIEQPRAWADRVVGFVYRVASQGAAASEPAARRTA